MYLHVLNNKSEMLSKFSISVHQNEKRTWSLQMGERISNFNNNFQYFDYIEKKDSLGA